jgi:hypothetical protein
MGADASAAAPTVPTTSRYHSGDARADFTFERERVFAQPLPRDAARHRVKRTSSTIPEEERP